MTELDLRVQQTPNPNSLLYHVDRTVTEERMQQFNSAEEAAVSPLALGLMEIEHVASVFFMPNSITVSKLPEGDWNAIGPAAERVIRTHLEGADA